jgi:RimJ/RimL family protein N-acetyltransferase
MKLPRLEIKDGFYLSPLRFADRQTVAKHERRKEISDGISAGSAYTAATMADAAHAKPPIAMRGERHLTEVARGLWAYLRARDDAPLFAVRNPAGTLVGRAGIKLTPDNPICGELHGWILPEYGRHGIMTIVLRLLCRYAFDEIGLLKLSATIFESNAPVARVLEKNGFTLEGKLRSHYMKDGKLIDARIYGLLKEGLDRTRRDPMTERSLTRGSSGSVSEA